MTPASAGAPSRRTSPGSSASTSSIGSARRCRPRRVPRPRRRRSTRRTSSRRPCRPRRRRPVVAAGQRAVTASIERCGTSSDIVDDVRSPRASIVIARVGSLGGASCDVRELRLQLEQVRSSAEQLLPDVRELLDEAGEHAAGQRQLDLGQLARRGASVVAAADQAVDQAQTAAARRRAGCVVPSGRVPTTPKSDGCGNAASARRPGQLVDVDHLELDGQRSSRGELRRRRAAERLVGALEAALLVRRELRSGG